MKLYATITSERASKGQGGNKWINIDLLVGSKAIPENAGRLAMRNEREVFYIDFYGPGDEVGKNLLTIQKGEKQKGEVCNELISDNGILGETRCKRINCAGHK